MPTTRLEKRKTNRFAAVDELSNQIFDEIVPAEQPGENATEPASRVRTRLLRIGGHLHDAARGAYSKDVAEPSTSGSDQRPFGWFLVLDGAGRGASFSLTRETSEIGRAEGQDVQLDFGDVYISRTGHAAVHYDPASRAIAVRSGRKPNPVLLNGKVLEGERPLNHGDRIRLGLTTLCFVAT
jgi:hypothetical protein